MAKEVEMLGVLVDPAQKQKVKRWAALLGGDMSTAVRTMIDSVELEVKPQFTVTQPDEHSNVVTVQR